MGWKRHHLEEMINKRRTKRELQEKGKKNREHLVSPNSDNYRYCWGCCKEKYSYDTKKKAELAAKYTPYELRVYYCDACCAYHTTSKLHAEDIKCLNNGFVKIAFA